MRSTSFTLKNISINITLILSSIVFSILLIEIALRFFIPKYQHLVESNYKKDSVRIWASNPNSYVMQKHPDSGLQHYVFYNNLSLRQHRNFSPKDIESAINIGIFGDSFTANTRLPVQYSFTEPLDYLLNLRGNRFNVLNFGVDGYGTDQSYLYYQELDFAKDIDHVFYIFCINDLRDIYYNGIFSSDKSGKLKKKSLRSSSWFVTFISKLHFTYLSMDILQRQFPYFDEINNQNIKDYLRKRKHKEQLQSRTDAIDIDFDKALLTKSFSLFQSILKDWKRSVESNGGEFYIVLLPRHWENLIADLIAEEFNIINLYQIFNNSVENYSYSDFKFKHDDHWNENGNFLAALHLYQFIEKKFNISPLSSLKQKEHLFIYYSAFHNGWIPNTFVTKTPASENQLIKINRKYSTMPQIK